MAIIPIDNLQEKDSAGENDFLVLSTQEGAKKIKAKNIGGGAGDFVVDFTITRDDTFTVTSETTLAQIYSAYESGKNVRGVGGLTGIGDAIFHMTHISDSLVVFFTFIEMESGNGLTMTIRGTSSGYTAYLYQWGGKLNEFTY